MRYRVERQAGQRCLIMDNRAELLEYLAEYCAEGGHTSIRYIEKVALNWYQAGIHTRDEAREHSTRYSKDTAPEEGQKSGPNRWSRL